MEPVSQAVVSVVVEPAKKKRKLTAEESKFRHKEMERLRWHRLQETQQEVVALLPPQLRQLSPVSQTTQLVRVVHYIAFLELLAVFGTVQQSPEQNWRLLPLLFGLGYRRQLLAEPQPQTGQPLRLHLAQVLEVLRQRICRLLLLPKTITMANRR